MKILVPVDYSTHAVRVVKHALDLASRLSADVTIAHVWETQPRVPAQTKVTTPDGRTTTLAALIREEAEAAMKTFLEKVKVPAGAKVSNKVLSGSAPEAIVKESERGGYDLIVMGTQARTGLGRLVLGSVAERVLRASEIPVLAIPMKKS